MKTNKLLYRIFLTQPSLIAELLPEIPANCQYFSGLFLYLHQYKIKRLWRGLLILHNREQDLGSEKTY
jgi:hypothetical protein